MLQDITEMLEAFEKSLKRNNNSAKYVFMLSILLINPKSKIIKFKEIADKVIEIYFRNIFKYNLIESVNYKQMPMIQKDILDYFEGIGIPKLMTLSDKENLIKITISRKSKGFFKYVLPCFLGAKKGDNGQYIYPLVGKNSFFLYDMNKEEIILTENFMYILKNNYVELESITVTSYIEYLEKLNPNKDIKSIVRYYIK